MNGITIYEFDALIDETRNPAGGDGLHVIPAKVYTWLEEQCLGADEGARWLKLTQRSKCPAIQVTSHVGVIRAPNGYQIEVLPKVGKVVGGDAAEARQLLIDMLCCLRGFRHIQTESAKLAAARMPLLEVFIAEFLRSVEAVVKHGLRGDYSIRRENLFALRGKLLMSSHLRQNLLRADRFFTEHDEFSANRPENRLLHAALRRVLHLSVSQENQRLGRMLAFAFGDVPPSDTPAIDFQRVRLDRGMDYYTEGLAWARLILDETSPLTGVGRHHAPSLLFPMEAVFEAFVARHLERQLAPPSILKMQVYGHHLVRHRGQDWFRMIPDLLIQEAGRNLAALDTKWKLLDGRKSSGWEKYGLSQADFYQLHAYGLSYLNGQGDLVLIYPKTATFEKPLPVFEFPKPEGLRLWVLPFCLKTRQLLIHEEAPFARQFSDRKKIRQFARPEESPNNRSAIS
ncbi:MAG: McrC family protein [Porticoccaceae bacterium]